MGYLDIEQFFKPVKFLDSVVIISEAMSNIIMSSNFLNTLSVLYALLCMHMHSFATDTAITDCHTETTFLRLEHTVSVCPGRA